MGDWILAAGNPFGLGGSVTAGIVSAEGRDLGSGPFDNFLQLDAPINPGNSGGPVFNMDGQVIGVTTAIVSPTGGSVGIGFAIPSPRSSAASSPSCAPRAASSAAGSASRSRMWRTAASSSPAWSATARRCTPACTPGDVVLALNGEPIDSARSADPRRRRDAARQTSCA